MATRTSPPDGYGRHARRCFQQKPQAAWQLPSISVLNGDLSIPEQAEGMIVFVHGSGSSRFSSRNRAVADMLVQVRLGTLLLDLLTEPEERKDASRQSSAWTYRCSPNGQPASSTGSPSRLRPRRYRSVSLVPAQVRRRRSLPQPNGRNWFELSFLVEAGPIWRKLRSIG
jgi:hypothetical protein